MKQYLKPFNINEAKYGINESKAYREAEKSGKLKPLLAKYKKYEKYETGDFRYNIFKELVEFGKSFNFDDSDWKTLGKTVGAGENAFKSAMNEEIS